MCQNLTNLWSGDFVFLAGGGAGEKYAWSNCLSIRLHLFYFPQKPKQNKKTIGYWVVRLYSSLAGLHPRELSVPLWLAKLYIARLLLLGFATWPFEGSGFFARPKPVVLVLAKGFSLRIQELGRIKRSAKTARKVENYFFSVNTYIDCRLTFQTVKISLLKWRPFCTCRLVQI